MICVGHPFTNNAGHRGVVVAYDNWKTVKIRFDPPYPYTTVVQASQVVNGNVKNRNAPSVYGWGIVGECSTHDPAYPFWNGMLRRVLDPKVRNKFPTYTNVDVCSEWQHFASFLEWFDDQYCMPGWQLDKDWLQPGNTMYSPNTCIMVPQELNKFLTNTAALRGDLPVGVFYHKKTRKYIAQLAMYGGDQQNLGSHTTPEAAYSAYVQAKETLAKQLARRWKPKIDPKLYEAMMQYTVEAYNGSLK